MTSRISALSAVLVLVILGGGYYFWQQRPQASTVTGYTYYCRNKSESSGIFDSSGIKTPAPTAATGTFTAGKDKPLEWSWPAYAGVTYPESKVMLSNESGYQETLTGYKVSLWGSHDASNWYVLGDSTVTSPAFASGPVTPTDGDTYDYYRIQYTTLCSSNDPRDPTPQGREPASASNAVQYAVASSPSTESSESQNSTDNTTSDDTSATSSESTSKSSPSTPTTTKKLSASTPKTTELYSTAATGLPVDTITEGRAFTTLPSSAVSIGITPSKAAKSVKLTLGSTTKDATKDGATGRYIATFDAPSDIADHPATAALTYDDGTTEDIALTVKVVAKGVVRDTAGAPVAGATVTLRQQAASGTFTDWSSTGTDQQNPTTTDASGSYGFVVPTGAYQVIAATADGRTVASDTITVSPMNGPVAPDLTLITAVTQTTTGNSGIPTWVWVLSAVLLLLISGYALMRSRTQIPPSLT